MQGFMPRFRRRIDRNSWVPIGEGSATTTGRIGAVSANARLDGPPVFGDPIEPQQSPPPTYSQVRNLSRPEIASLIVRRGPRQGTAGLPSSTTPRRSVVPYVSGQVTTLDDIRHTERDVQLDNRLSSVPSYPVFLDIPGTLNQRRSRPASIASTNTAGLCMSISQLPGSEHFDDGISHVAPERSGPLNSHPLVSPLLSPMSPFEASVAQAMTVHRVNRSSTVSSPPTHSASWCVDTSANFADRWNPPTQGYYSPELENQPFVKPSQTWPRMPLEQRAAQQRADPRVQFIRPREGARDINTPPTPPPKDPGYVARPPGRRNKNGLGLHKSHSTPNLLLFPRVDRNIHERTRSDGPQLHNNGATNPSRPQKPKRMSSSRKPSQILNLCAKFINRSIPRVSVSC